MQAIEDRFCDRAVPALTQTLVRAGLMEGGSLRRSVSGSPQGGLCSAEHNPPYAQCRIMRSAGLAGLVVAGSAGERCA